MRKHTHTYTLTHILIQTDILIPMSSLRLMFKCIECCGGAFACSSSRHSLYSTKRTLSTQSTQRVRMLRFVCSGSSAEPVEPNTHTYKHSAIEFDYLFENVEIILILPYTRGITACVCVWCDMRWYLVPAPWYRVIAGNRKDSVSM